MTPTPTPEQVAQWAREAGVTAMIGHSEEFSIVSPADLQRLVTRAMAAQAEADAAFCELWNATAGEVLAKEIRANAPKLAKRCELCQYDHGHSIGCENNPVDIALKAKNS